MSSVSEDRLSKAYRLIEAEELGAARAILQPLLADEPDNVDAWWLYAHAVADPVAAREALDHVLRIDPNYPGAAELSESLNDVLIAEPPELVAAPDEEDFVLAPPPPVLPDVPAPVEAASDMPDFEDETPARRRSSLIPAIIAAIIVVLIVVIIGILLTGRGQTPTVTTGLPPTQPPVVGVVSTPTNTPEVIAPVPTEEATEIVPPTEIETEPPTAETQEVIQVPTDTATPIPTEVPTETPVPTEIPTDTPVPTVMPTATQEIATEEPTPETTEDLGMMAVTEQAAPPAAETPEVTPPVDVTVTPVAGDFNALTVSLAGFTLPDNAIGTARTDLGNTLVVTVCTRPGDQLRRDLPTVMDSISKQLRFMPAGTDAVGARMYDCQANRVLLIILASINDAAQYMAGNLSEADYQALWKPH